MPREWQGGGHIALGYRSPGDYLHAEFEGALSGIDIPARRLAVRSMTEWGLSTRAISKPLGISDITVRRDQGATSVAPALTTPARDRPTVAVCRHAWGDVEVSS